MATSKECQVPLTGVCGMAATQPSFQGGKTMSSSSGYAVAAMSASAESHSALKVVSLLASPSETDPGCPAVAASYHRGHKVECQSWLMDTGCKYDFTTRDAVPLPLRDSITDSADPVTLLPLIHL